MKKYSRKGLIAFFSKMPPRSKPCGGDAGCPISTYMAGKYFHQGIYWPSLDPDLAAAMDGQGGWWTLTAARIVKIAKALGEKK